MDGLQKLQPIFHRKSTLETCRNELHDNQKQVMYVNAAPIDLKLYASAAHLRVLMLSLIFVCHEEFPHVAMQLLERAQA